MAITGTAESFEDHYPKIRSSQVTIEFGEPFIIPARVPRKAQTGAKPAEGDEQRTPAAQEVSEQAGDRGGQEAPAERTVRTLTAEEKKFAGAYTRDVILDMLLKEKRLREGQ